MKKTRTYLLFGVIVLLVVGLILCLAKCQHDGSNTSPVEPLEADEGAVAWEGNQSLSDPHSTDGIAIPGFDRLTFVAGTTGQRVNFYNPEVNSCLFLMSLYVKDALYWQSGYVEPGKGYYSIELTEGLPAGIYDAALLVQCYKPSGEALNSARIEFELTVTEANER